MGGTSFLRRISGTGENGGGVRDPLPKSEANLVNLTDEAWSDMGNTDSYGVVTFEDVDALAMEYDRNITWTLERFGNEVPAPIPHRREYAPHAG